MFVEHKEAGEVTEAPAKVLKVSEAIRIGRPLIKEEDAHWFHLCALGCAWAGIRGKRMTQRQQDRYVKLHESPRAVARAIAKDLGINEQVAMDVNVMHGNGISALEIADWLELRGH